MNPIKVNKRYFQDKQTFSLMVFFLFFSVVMIVWMVLQIHSSDFPVIVRRGSDFDKASWTELYSYPLFVAVVAAVNTLVSMRFHEIHPKAARLVLGVGLGVVLYASRVGLAVIGL
jgi:hypothetical protein